MNYTAKNMLEIIRLPNGEQVQISEHTDICEENTVHASKYG
jgi:hypothetical protein